MTWTHRICADCYIERGYFSPHKKPVTLVPDATPEEEPCCFCSIVIVNVGKHGGIYVRHDPAQLDCDHE